MTTLQKRLRDPSHWCAMRRFTDSGYMGDVDDAPIKASYAIDELVAALEMTSGMLLAIAKTYGATRENWFSRNDDPSHEPVFLGEHLDNVDTLIGKYKEQDK